MKNKHRVSVFSLDSFGQLENEEEIGRAQIHFGACTRVFKLGFAVIFLEPIAVSIMRWDI